MNSSSTFLVLIFFLVSSLVSNACKINLNVEGGNKAVYQSGEIIIVKITVVLEHRNCDVSIEDTKISVSGSKIVGATKWVNVDGNTWERKIKIKIHSDPQKIAQVVAERTCHKDGGKGVLKLTTI